MGELTKANRSASLGFAPQALPCQPKIRLDEMTKTVLQIDVKNLAVALSTLEWPLTLLANPRKSKSGTNTEGLAESRQCGRLGRSEGGGRNQKQGRPQGQVRTGSRTRS